jgi:hypothetical protein
VCHDHHLQQEQLEK